MDKEAIRTLFTKLQQDSNYTTDEIKLFADLTNHYSKSTTKIEASDIKDFKKILNTLQKTNIDKSLNRYKYNVYLLYKKEPNVLLEQYMKNELEILKNKLS